jgi:glycosyltransferase involved in cell wall biosynthesis
LEDRNTRLRLYQNRLLIQLSMYRLAVLNSHPIQYFTPFYRRLSLEPDIDLTVYYCSRKGLDAYFDGDFGERVRWDIDLLQGYQYEFLPNFWRNSEGIGFLGLLNPSIIERLRNGRFDAVIIHGHQHSTMLLGALTAKLSKTALMTRCDTHLQLRRSSLKHLLRKLLLAPYYRQFDACLAVGTRNEMFYKALGVPAERIFLIPFAVDNQLFARPAGFTNDQREQLRKAYNLPPKKPLILFVSKLQDRKHPLHLLKAFALLLEKGHDASLVFIGSGKQEEVLVKWVEQNKIPDVTFLGFRNQGDLPSLYGISDIFVLPSDNEPWGLVINEAMAAGLPVIASEEVGAVPDLVQDNVNGFTFAVGDINALSHCLQVLVCDQQLRSRMGRESLAIIKRWDFEQGVKEMRTVLAFVRSAESH